MGDHFWQPELITSKGSPCVSKNTRAAYDGNLSAYSTGRKQNTLAQSKTTSMEIHEDSTVILISLPNLNYRTYTKRKHQTLLQSETMKSTLFQGSHAACDEVPHPGSLNSEQAMAIIRKQRDRLGSEATEMLHRLSRLYDLGVSLNIFAPSDAFQYHLVKAELALDLMVENRISKQGCAGDIGMVRPG